jgi:hypothetical protein
MIEALMEEGPGSDGIKGEKIKEGTASQGKLIYYGNCLFCLLPKSDATK